MTETAAVTGQRFRRKPEISLEDQKGTIRCGHCGREWNHNNNGNLAEAHEQFEEHLREKHPEFQPRSIEQIRKEIDRGRKEAKEEEKRKEGELQLAARKAAQKAEPRVSKPRRASQLRREPRSRRQQPFLTEEMIEEARRLYKEEELSVRDISRRHHTSWGYSLNGLRNVLYKAFKDAGIDVQKDSRKMARKPSRMTPERVGVAWHLYSAGGYSLREIGEMSHELWGYASSSCQNSIGEALKRADHKLRANRWEQGPRTIDREVAIKIIRSVS